MNGTKVLSNITPTNRAVSTATAAMAYFTFTATSGGTTQIVFSPNASSSSSNKNVVINAFGLNVPNAASQASVPKPTDRDLHVDADAGSATLSWTAAKSVTQHGVYFGTDSATVASATTSSTTYKGKQSGLTYAVSGFNNS